MFDRFSILLANSLIINVEQNCTNFLISSKNTNTNTNVSNVIVTCIKKKIFIYVFLFVINMEVFFCQLFVLFCNFKMCLYRVSV